MSPLVFAPDTPLSDLPRGWRITSHCGCTRSGTVLVADLLAQHGAASLATVAGRLRCRGCGRRPSTVIASEPHPPADALRPLWGVLRV